MAGMRSRRTVALFLALIVAAGCATTPPPYVGQGPHPQITRGKPIPPVDFIGNVFGVLMKIVLWDRRVDNHSISAETESYLVRYIEAPVSNTDGTHFSLNEYAPGRALSRLARNKKVAWPYRLIIGLPVTLIIDVLLPGRLFSGIVGGDMYNPYTDTVAIFSDHPAILLHEAGHADDFNDKRFKGTYALIRIIPFVDLYQEFQASDEAFSFLIETADHEQEVAAYKILFPAFGTYIGGYSYLPGGSLIGALVGHIVGRLKAGERKRHYEQLSREAAPAAPAAASTGPEPAPVTP
jgi:hypothetical protein